MRDVTRIKRICDLIFMIWVLCPDMRLGQLLQNFAGFSRGDNWHLEDDIIEKCLNLTLKDME